MFIEILLLEIACEFIYLMYLCKIAMYKYILATPLFTFHSLSHRVDDNYNIKVADFGLTRDIYSTEYYRANGHTRLPVKWMSPESLADHFFDEKTDVVWF